MEDTERIVFENLIRIYLAPDECLSRYAFMECPWIPDYGFDSIVEYMVEQGLVETEYDDRHTFFLTEYGYDCIEQGYFVPRNSPARVSGAYPDAGQELDRIAARIERFGRRRYYSYMFLGLFIFGFFVTLVLYLNRGDKQQVQVPAETPEQFPAVIEERQNENH